MEYPNIRSLREDHDFRQCDLASVLHVSQNTYSQYENGVIELTAERLVKLADFYNVSIDYLLGRTDNPEVNRNYKCRAAHRESRGIFASEQTLHQNDGDQDRQNVFKVGLDPLRHFGAAAGVALGGVFVETPAPFGDTEQQINKAAARQQNVADKEVLKIQYGAARAQGLDAAPHVVAQRAGQAQHDQRRRAHQTGPAAVPAEIFPRTGDDVLKHCQ